MKNVVITGSTRVSVYLWQGSFYGPDVMLLSGRHEVLPEAARSALSSFEGSTFMSHAMSRKK